MNKHNDAVMGAAKGRKPRHKYGFIHVLGNAEREARLAALRAKQSAACPFAAQAIAAAAVRRERRRGRVQGAYGAEG